MSEQGRAWREGFDDGYRKGREDAAKAIEAEGAFLKGSGHVQYLHPREAARIARGDCSRCHHPEQSHWEDDDRSQPGCHSSGCLCSFSPAQVHIAMGEKQ